MTLFFFVVFIYKQKNMSKLFLISEEEKNRIINLHEYATNRHYLSEQLVTNYDGKYDYKKENDKYYFKLKNTDNWKEATGEPLNAIKTKVFKGVVTDTNPKQNDLPFKNREEGNTFRKWVNETLPFWAKKLKLDPSGSHTNSFIIDAWNYEVPLKSGKTMKLGDVFKLKKPLTDEKTGGVQIMPGFNPEFKDKINFENLKINDTTKNFCKPSDKECAQFVNDISTDIGYIGNAWDAYGLDTKIGPTIYSSFKGIDTNNIQNIIKYWQEINKRPGSQKWVKNGPLSNKISQMVDSLVPKTYNGTKLKPGDFVGIYYPGSKNHERAFYDGGKRWFVDGNPGDTIKKGKGWGMNTHIGRVGVVKNGVPLIFHNVDGTTKSDPPQNLRIAWVKRK